MRFFTANRLIAWGTVALPLLTIGSTIGAAIVYAVRLGDSVSARRAADVDHESRLRTIEATAADTRGDVREIRTDVRWIKDYLDKPPLAADSRTAAAQP